MSRRESGRASRGPGGFATSWRNSWLVLGATLCVVSGCANDYVGRTRDVRKAYQAGEPTKALELLEAEKQVERDRLLYLLDRGTVLHEAGEYEESIQVLAEADRLSQELDFVSVSQEAAVLLTSERERPYKGEDFEKLLISVYQALNYSQLGQHDAALVEVRRINERLRKMVTEEEKPYQQLAVARYLAGVLWERQGELDSAFIDYLKASELQPELGHLAAPLLRLARATNRDDWIERLEARYPDVDGAPLPPGTGEVVVLVKAGLAPEKKSVTQKLPQLIAIPVFEPRWRPNTARIRADGEVVDAVTLTSVNEVAHLHLAHRVAGMVAQQLAGTAVKGGVSIGVAALTGSEDLGMLTFYLLSLSNQPDLRSWLSLPAEFQAARLVLPEGRQTIEVMGVERVVEVQSGRPTLLLVRRY